MSIPEGYFPVEFGCGCKVRGARPWEANEGFIPELKGKIVRVHRFDFVCDEHLQWVVLRSSGRMVRLQVGRSKHSRFWVCSGEQLTLEQEQEIYNAANAVFKVRNMAKAEQITWDRKQVEGWLVSKGWTKEGEGEWTAPEELRAARASRGADRYVKTTFGHAVNTQRLMDGGIPRRDQRRILDDERDLVRKDL